MMELINGRPAADGDRLPRELRVYDFLDKLGIAYSRVDHAPAETMEDCKAIDEVLGTAMCKNLFLCNRQKTRFYLLLMSADKPFKTKELSAQINAARLSFASGEHMLAYLDIQPGAVSVLGLMNDTENDVTLLVDEDLLQSETIGCHPCVNTSSLLLKTDDVLHTFLPAVRHSFQTVKLVGE